jgi:hypothetical protein
MIWLVHLLVSGLLRLMRIRVGAGAREQALSADELRAMVMEGGNASIKYADGCVLALGSGSLAVVGQQSSCASGSKNVAQIAALSAQAAGDTERDCDGDNIFDSQDDDIDGDGKLNADDNYENCKAGAGIWIASGLAVAGAAALISDGDDETISP